MSTMARATKSQLFKPGAPAMNRAAATEHASRAIIDAEAAARRKKTVRLRKLRLEPERGTAGNKPEPAGS